MDSQRRLLRLLRRLPALLLILLVGLAPATAAVRTVTVQPAAAQLTAAAPAGDLPQGPAPEPVSERMPGQAGPVDAPAQLSDPLVASWYKLRPEPRLDVVAASPGRTAGGLFDARSTPLPPEPGIGPATPSPLFLLHCSYLC